MAKGSGGTRSSRGKATLATSGAPKSIPMNQVTYSGDSHYKAVYGKRPSGTGTWAFDFGDGPELIYGSYSEVKKWAIKEAAKRGVRTVKLGL